MPKLITIVEDDFNYLKMEAGKLVAEVRSLVKKIENHDPTSGIALAPHAAPAVAQADTVETQLSTIATAPVEPTPEPTPQAPAETAPEAPTPTPEPEAPASS